MRGADVGPPRKSNDAQTSEIIAVALAVMTGLVIIARPTNDMPPPFDAAGSPRAVVVAQAPAPDRPTPVRARRPRSPRWPAAPPGVPPLRASLQSP